MAERSYLFQSDPLELDPCVTRSCVRSGHKRDFEFAMRSHAEVGISIGRTRSCRARNVETLTLGVEGSGSERVQGSSSRSPIVIEGDDRGKAVEGARVLRKPSNVDELLKLGFFDGIEIKCILGIDEVENGLTGMIKGGEILCYCYFCKGIKAISADQFGEHAGVLEGSPAECIYFENGKTLHNILEVCKASHVETFEFFVQEAIGATPSKKMYHCQNCGESFHTSSNEFTMFCDPCCEPSQEMAIPSTPHGTANSVSPLKKTSVNKKAKKLTKKDMRLHKLVFMNEAVLKEVKEQTVKYIVGGKIAREGKVCDSGIFCFCCEEVVSPSKFEVHAGHAQKRKPYHHIYLPGGVSLHELSVRLSKERLLSNKEKDDLYNTCHEDRDLLGHDACPRAFHIDMQERKKAMKYTKNAVAAGRVAGTDPVEDLVRRCIRVVKKSEVDIGVCVFCREQDYSTSGFGPRTVVICDQCQREHHVGCLKAQDRVDLKELPTGEWFCCDDCSMINDALQNLIRKGAEPLAELDATMINRKSAENGSVMEANVHVRWRLLYGRTHDDADELLLSEAISIFRESFATISDQVTNKDLLWDMVHGEVVEDYDYTGMYCALLTVRSSVQSAGIIRVLGRDVAELPLIATRRDNQGLGYFGALFSCLEKLLASLNVKRLIVPSAEESVQFWTTKFGFSPVTEEELNSYLKGVRTTVFEGTSTLWKRVPGFC